MISNSGTCKNKTPAVTAERSPQDALRVFDEALERIKRPLAFGEPQVNADDDDGHQ